MGDLVGHWNEPKPATEGCIRERLGKTETGHDALELVAVDPADDRDRGSIRIATQLDQREALVGMGWDPDPSSLHGNHRAERTRPCAP